jgi:Protein of unknown function (DUF2971).
MADKLPDIVYHYCSLSSFCSIISHKNIRLSCHIATNDYHECTWIDKIFSKVPNSEINRDFIDKVIEQFHFSRNFAWRTKGVYLACFSEHGDQLSQWRAYADDGRGVAIGFSTDGTGFANLFRSEHMPMFGKVIYSEQKQVQVVKDIFCKYEADYDPACLDIAVVFCANALSNIAPLIKNPAFKEEMEWRIIYQPDIGWDVCGEFEISQAPSEIKFHVKGSTLLPYFEYNFPLDIISHVVIGPKSSQEHEFIRFFLGSHGFNRTFKIDLSVASYR